MENDEPVITVELFAGDGYSLTGDFDPLLAAVEARGEWSPARFDQLVREGVLQLLRRVEVPMGLDELHADAAAFERIVTGIGGILASAAEERAARAQCIVAADEGPRLRPGTPVEVQTAYTRYDAIVADTDTDGLHLHVHPARQHLFVPWSVLMANLHSIRPTARGPEVVAFVGLFHVDPLDPRFDSLDATMSATGSPPGVAGASAAPPPARPSVPAPPDDQGDG